MFSFTSVLLLPVLWAVSVYRNFVDAGWWIKMFLSKRIRNSISRTKKRLTYDPKSDDLREVGILPSPIENQLERPSQDKNEEIKIIGFKSDGKLFLLNIKWQPKSNKTAAIAFSLLYEDGEGNKFTDDCIDLVQNPQDNCEYKAKGLCLQVLHPFKRIRITFRGFLRKNDSEELIFVNLRLLWLANSNVFDYQSDHNADFIAKEVVRNSKSAGLFGRIPNFEDRIEQFGQMKGTIQMGDGNESELYLWGSRSKRFDDKHEMRVRRLFGYTQKGLAFHVGIVYDWMNCYKYRYGIVYNGTFKAAAIKSATGDWPLDKELPEELQFILETNKSFEIKVYNKNDVIKVTVNGVEGRAVQWLDDGFAKVKTSIGKRWSKIKTNDKLVVAIDSEEAENQMTSGGKGASLALLTVLNKQLNQNANTNEMLEVPSGIIVTTQAYQLMLDLNPEIRKEIDEAQHSICDTLQLKDKCSRIAKMICECQIPVAIRNEIENLFNEKFKIMNDNQKPQFAVRSSAVGEDSEVMSTAGQMTTFLGVKSLDEVCSSVMKCWASQFDFVAVEYKRGYGQAVNQPMAVVIQPMVDCEAAGVMFTCDPISGDQRRVLVTANLGLGESVVAAIAEPDTVELDVCVKRCEVGEYSEDKLIIAGIKSIQIGSKNKMVNLSGITEVDEDQQKKCSISEETAIRLGKVSLTIKDFFGDDRDIEWGYRNGKIYIFQSRPVTNLNTFSDFELIHEMDTGLPSEFEVLSKANAGEAFPNTSSILGIDFINLVIARYFAENNKAKGLSMSENYCSSVLLDFAWNSNQFFFNLKNSELMKLKGSEQSAMTKGMILAIFGHPVDDPEINAICGLIAEPESTTEEMKKLISVLIGYFRADYAKLFEQLKQKHKNMDTSAKTLEHFFQLLQDVPAKLSHDGLSHLYTLIMSSMFNLSLILMLKTKDENPHLYSDFALIMSECQNVVSSDLPKQIEKIAEVIEEEGNRKKFLEMIGDEAKAFLMTGQTKGSQEFLNFIEKHGHRSTKEYDCFEKSLEMDPTLIINGIRNLLSAENRLSRAKERKSIDEVVSSLKTPLSGTKKLLMKKLLLPMARSAVGQREMTKSILVYACNAFRRVCWSMAERMYQEGRIPEKELFFFLNFDELQQLLATRNPLLVAKAKRRLKLRQQLETWKFDEICKGYEFKPKQASTQMTLSSEATLKGTPVSHGQVMTARVCVAKSIEEAKLIQPGDILVTYSTDIGWSPFFPIISGIITEIGGLISHGAVIAREFGIPCLVGVDEACLRLTTGQMVTLDTRQGTVSRVLEK